MKRIGMMLLVLVMVFGLVGFAESKIDVSKLTNLALSKPVTEFGHDYQSDYWNKDFITDGIKMYDDNEGSTNGWFSDKSSSKEEQTWIYVDLEADYKVGAIALYPRESEKYFPVDYELQISANAENWTTVKTVTGDSGKKDVDRVFAITPTEARYVRVLVTERNGEVVTNGYIAQISELEVYEYEEETNVETSDESYMVFAATFILLTTSIVLSVSRKRISKCR